MSIMGHIFSKFQNLAIEPTSPTTKVPSGDSTSRPLKRKLDRTSISPRSTENGTPNIQEKERWSPTKRGRLDIPTSTITVRRGEKGTAQRVAEPLDTNATIESLGHLEEDEGYSEGNSGGIDEEDRDSGYEDQDEEEVLDGNEAGDSDDGSVKGEDGETEAEDGQPDGAMEVDEAEHADDSIVVEDSKKHHEDLTSADIEAEKQRRQAETDKLRESGWYPSELALFHKMSLRGMEPLLPKDWEFDFSSIPRALFTYDLNEAFIKPYGYPYSPSADFRAKKVLHEAMGTGPLVRLAIRNGYPGERWLKRLMDVGLKWIYTDTGLIKRDGWLPVLYVVKGNRNADPEALQHRLVKHLSRLEVAWKQKLEGKEIQEADQCVSFPQLYGVIITSSVLALVSYVPRDRPVNEDAQFFGSTSLRLHGLFNFGKTTHDVWNAFAVVILMVHCRELLMKALNETRLIENLGWLEESDPDA